MRSRSVTFFMLPNEASDLLRNAQASCDVCVYGVDEQTQKLALVNRVEPRLFLGPRLSAPPSSRTLVPARHGLVSFHYPGVSETSLFLGEIATRLEWIDESGKAHEVAGLEARFDCLKALAIRGSHAGLWAQNTRTGRSSFYRAVWISDEALAWAKSGNELRQIGVSNVRYLIEAPASTP